MFDIGWTEMLVVAVVMILVVGPKDLPGMLRTIGKSVGNLRRMAGDFQRQFSDALKEADIDEVKKDLAKTTSFTNPLDDINKSADDLMSSLDLDEKISIDGNEDNKISADVSKSKPATAKGTTKAAAKPKSTKTAAASKTPAKKTVAKKTIVKKTVAKKPVVKKTVAKKPTPRRKATTDSKSA